VSRQTRSGAGDGHGVLKALGERRSHAVPKSMGIRGVRARPALIAQEVFGLELERLPVNGLDLRVGANPELGLAHFGSPFPDARSG